MTYLIRLRGQVDADDINALSPVAVRAQTEEQRDTVLAACCDQSALIGLLRHLHGLGLELLSIQLSAGRGSGQENSR